VAESRVTACMTPFSVMTLLMPILRVINAFKPILLPYALCQHSKKLGSDGFYLCFCQ
jgi:hypothetical protein